MPRCSNSTASLFAYHKGNEPSPSGLGLCSKFENVGTMQTGLDTRQWIVTQRGQSHVWTNAKRASPRAKTRTAESRRPTSQDSNKNLFKEDMISLKSLRQQNSMTKENSPLSEPKVQTIVDRCKYSKAVKQYIKDVPPCLVADSYGVFHMGDQMTLSKRIGSDSKYGIAYLAEGTGQSTGSIIKVAAKVIRNRRKDGRNHEVAILDILSRKVCSGFPNFPMMYAVLKCDKAICRADDRDCHALFKDRHLVILNEIAVGDLSMWLRKPRKPSQCYSAIAQIIVALMAFNELGFVHNDTHWGNFLYHNVPAGGCWHYVIDGEDIYVENTGQVWVLWDFGMSSKFTTYSKKAYDDYTRIMNAFIHSSSFGWLKNPKIVSPTVSNFALRIKTKLSDDIATNTGNPIYKLIKEVPSLRRKVGEVLNASPYVINTNKLLY